MYDGSSRLASGKTRQGRCFAMPVRALIPDCDIRALSDPSSKRRPHGLCLPLLQSRRTTGKLSGRRFVSFAFLFRHTSRRTWQLTINRGTDLRLQAEDASGGPQGPFDEHCLCVRDYLEQREASIISAVNETRCSIPLLDLRGRTSVTCSHGMRE